MKYLESFNNNNYTSDQMDNINDICLELEDLDLQYRIIVSTVDYYNNVKYINHLFTDWDSKEAKHSKSEKYEKNMTIEIYDKYDEYSGGGCEGGDIKVTNEFWSIIMRLKEYLNTDITIQIIDNQFNELNNILNLSFSQVTVTLKDRKSVV